MNTTELPARATAAILAAKDTRLSLSAIAAASILVTTDTAKLARVAAYGEYPERPEDSAETTADASLWWNTYREAAKLLLAARDIVVITDGSISQAYWCDDLAGTEWEMNDGRGITDYRGFQAETMPASCEFQPGSADTEALCTALIAAGSKQIDA